MKILFAHNEYLQHGGEDAVLSMESSLLDSHHQTVRHLKINNNSTSHLTGRIKTAFACCYSGKNKKKITKLLNITKPDIVHVHNFFPLLTPSIYDACIDADVPVIQTLHNYRTICPGALLMRNGKICEKCITGSPYHAILYRCYRNSIPGSWAVARMVAYHRKRQTWPHKVDRFIALTDFGKHKFVEAGFPAEKIVVKPNSYQGKGAIYKLQDTSRKGALFVGRLSGEKGVATLLKAWQNLNAPLRMAGGGPLLESAQQVAGSKISLLGQISAEQVSDEMSKAAFLVMPSEWYEGFPMVLVESFAHGLPVIASRLGGMAEIVEDGVTGLHFEPGNPEDLAQKVQWMQDHPKECRQMGENARLVYEDKYTPEKNYEMLMDIYQQAIEGYSCKF